MFRFAILGAAKIARKFVEAVRLADDCTVAAVASKSLEKANAFARDNGIPKAYDQYETMLRTEKPDCAYLATTQNDHFRLAMLCLDCGVPVLCEKAMFMNAADAAVFFARAESMGLFSMEALWSRFLPANIQAREWLRSGKIGKPALLDARIGFRASRDGENRYFSPRLGGGAAFDILVYAEELAEFMLDAPLEKLSAQAVWSDSLVDETDVVLATVGGCAVSLRTSFACKLHDLLAVYGPEGRIEVPRPHFASTATLFDADGREIERFEDQKTRNGFVYEIEETARCVRAGLTESPVVPHAATLACARVFDLLYRDCPKEGNEHAEN